MTLGAVWLWPPPSSWLACKASTSARKTQQIQVGENTRRLCGCGARRWFPRLAPNSPAAEGWRGWKSPQTPAERPDDVETCVERHWAAQPRAGNCRCTSPWLLPVPSHSKPHTSFPLDTPRDTRSSPCSNSVPAGGAAVLSTGCLSLGTIPFCVAPRGCALAGVVVQFYRSYNEQRYKPLMDMTVREVKCHYTTVLGVLSYVTSPKRDLHTLPNRIFPMLRDCRGKGLEGRAMKSIWTWAILSNLSFFHFL